MRTTHGLAAALALLAALGLAVVPVMAAPDDEAPEGLVYVKPADIGPKRGDVAPEREADEGAEPRSGSGDPATAEVGPALEVIFDCSRSMNGRMGGVPKIALAKDALFHLTESLAQTNLQVGLRVFGHTTSIDPKDRSQACSDSELVVPIAMGSADRIRSRIPRLAAWGLTPIATSLERAGEDLAAFEQPRIVLLISDGLESCGRDPIAALAALKQRGIDVRTFVIGFDINPKERAALERLAAAGGGTYYNASDYRELLRSFDAFVQEAAKARKPQAPRYTNPSQGGETFEQATVIGPGRYTLWKDLPKGEWGYFKVASTKGQRVAIRATVQANAIYRAADGTFREAKYAEGGAMLKMFHPDGKPITGRTILLRGAQGAWQRQHTLDITGEGSVFALGDNYGPTSKHVVFEVLVQEAGDLYEGFEAPADVGSADVFDAEFDRPFFGHLGTEDRADVYRLDLAAAGRPDQVTLKIAFSDVDAPCKFLIELYHPETRRRITRFSKLESSAELTLPTQGLDGCYLLIKDNNPSLYHLMNSYKLELASR